MNLRILTIIIALLFYQEGISQKNVSITIDDVPSTSRFQKDGYKYILLHKLDALEIPIAIFINEGLLYKSDSVSKNFELLNSWAQREYITLDNHSFSHSRYSEVGIDAFKKDILKGEYISNELSKKHNKTLRYFRFPFNDLGKDSTQHKQVKNS